MTHINTNPFLSLQTKLNEGCAYLIEDPIDLFYLLNKPISLGHLLIEKEKITLFVDGRYKSAFSALTGLKTLPSEKDGVKHYLAASQLKKVFFDGDKTSYSRALELKKHTPIAFEAHKQLLGPLRLIKSEKEIAAIRESAHLLSAIYQAFLMLPKLGLSEKQLAQQFQLLSFEKGAEGFSFEPIMATGPHSAFPHHRPGNRVLQEGDVLLVDVGITKNGYQSDMTRMLFFGHVPPTLLTYHDYVLQAHQAALKLCRPGMKIGLLDKAAREVFTHHGVEALFCHSLGHGLGLETHEAPRIKWDGPDKELVLEKGMVITIEPGLYQEGLGGIRHEDLIVITEEGYENFYPSFF